VSKHSKAYRQAAELVQPDKIYSPLEAANLAKQASPTKFDGTVEVALRLGVDPRKADQMVRGTVSLPHGTGKTARVLVPPGRTGSAVTTSSRRSPTVSSTSTPPSRRPIRWPRWAASPGFSGPVA
jgi:ribosomal protein L1